MMYIKGEITHIRFDRKIKRFHPAFWSIHVIPASVLGKSRIKGKMDITHEKPSLQDFKEVLNGKSNRISRIQPASVSLEDSSGLFAGMSWYQQRPIGIFSYYQGSSAGNQAQIR
jgi:hypothetical protein